jgi:hypothetical protein
MANNLSTAWHGAFYYAAMVASAILTLYLMHYGIAW